MSMHTARDRGAHDRRRRVWDRGFSTKCKSLQFSIFTLANGKIALRDYQSRVTKYAYDLVRKFSENAGKPVNMTQWLAYYSFDVMGDLTFGKSFDLLESGKQHFAIKMMHDGQSLLGVLGPIPWALPILKRVPGAVDNFLRWVKWSEQRVKDRMEVRICHTQCCMPS
jgi:hypothetical protein